MRELDCNPSSSVAECFNDTHRGCPEPGACLSVQLMCSLRGSFGEHGSALSSSPQPLRSPKPWLRRVSPEQPPDKLVLPPYRHPSPQCLAVASLEPWCLQRRAGCIHRATVWPEVPLPVPTGSCAGRLEAVAPGIPHRRGRRHRNDMFCLLVLVHLMVNAPPPPILHQRTPHLFPLESRPSGLELIWSQFHFIKEETDP